MPTVAVVLTNGFEEIEAVTIIDVLRRADLQVRIAVLEGDGAVGGHGIRLGADTTISALDSAGLDAIVLPGGEANARALREDARVKDLLKAMASGGKYVAAICAAPIALDAAGVLDGVSATSYPGFDLPNADYRTERVVEDGKIITSRGPGTAMEFSLALVRRLVGHEKATSLRQSMLVSA